MAYYKMYNNNNNNRNNDNNGISWGLIAFLVLIGLWPVAIFFTIVKLKIQRDKQRLDSNGWQSPYAGSNPARYTPTQGTMFEENDNDNDAENARTSAQESQNLKNAKLVSNLLIILGAVTAVFAVPGLHRCIFSLMHGFFDAFTVEYSLLPALPPLFGGGLLTFFGTRMKRMMRRENLMKTIAGDVDNISIKELSAASGYDKKKTIDILKSAVSHGLFGPTAYIDMRTSTLVIRGKAPQPAPKKPRKKKAETDVAEPQNHYEEILHQLRKLNDDIPGEEMSEKIDKLEDISRRIFALAEKDPEKKPHLSKFMDYYLPTALKLLSTYATLDSQGLQGQNVTETKASIENAMDMLVTAFEGQLDKLFQSDALDISGDIAALQSMLTMDGLTGGIFDSDTQTPEV